MTCETLMRLVYSLLLGALAFPATMLAQSPIRITAMGDSITLGATRISFDQPVVEYTYGYRSGLYARLTDTGYSFQFAGTSHANPDAAINPPAADCANLDALGQNNHEGYGGQGTSFLLNHIVDFMHADDPDVVLLMIGINDIGQYASGHPVGVERRLSQLVESITTMKPSTHVIVAQTMGYAHYTDSIIQYNNYIRDVLAPTYAAQGKLVTTVDQYQNLLSPSNPALESNGFIDPAKYSNEINHPTRDVYDRMAQTWFEGIQALGPIASTTMPSSIRYAPRIDDANVFRGAEAAVSSSYENTFSASSLTDGGESTFVFSDADSQRAIAIHGFDGSFDLLRLWNMSDRVPESVTILTSMNDNGGSLNFDDYTLLSTVSALDWSLSGYADVAVNAPAGTRSILLAFGPGNNAPGAQICEVQAFMTPEPSSLAILGVGLGVCLVWSRRKRRFASIVGLAAAVLASGFGVASADDAAPSAGDEAPILCPFWLTNVIHDEPVLFVKSDGAAEGTASLLFVPTRILSVRDSSGEIVYEEGRDFRWTAGTRSITVPEGSRICVKTPQDLLRPAQSQPYNLSRRSGPDEILLGASHEYHDMQPIVTYEYDRNDWKGPTPGLAVGRLPRTLQKLEAKEPLAIALLGDSISTGCNASAWANTAPFQPAYQDLLVNNLRAAYGGEIALKNFSVGGMGAEWGLKTIDKVIEVKPDLVILAFGMNDACGRPVSDYRSDTQGMIAAVHKALPTAEVILVATSLGNVDWTAIQPGLFMEYREALRKLCRTGVALADMTSIWAELLKHKSYYDLTGNGVNHPNDFGHRVYAEVLSSLLIPAEKLAGN